MNSGNAADLLGLSTNSGIRIRFAEKQEEIKKNPVKRKSPKS